MLATRDEADKPINGGKMDVVVTAQEAVQGETQEAVQGEAQEEAQGEAQEAPEAHTHQIQVFKSVKAVSLAALLSDGPKNLLIGNLLSSQISMEQKIASISTLSHIQPTAGSSQQSTLK